jgi:hypothetical protein
MFAHRYFATRYWAPRYWDKAGADPVAPTGRHRPIWIWQMPTGPTHVRVF